MIKSAGPTGGPGLPASQSPVVCHRRALLRRLQVDLDQLDVDADGVQPLVAQHLLEFEHIAAVAQEGDSEGVAEAMAGQVLAGCHRKRGPTGVRCTDLPI